MFIVLGYMLYISFCFGVALLWCCFIVYQGEKHERMNKGAQFWQEFKSLSLLWISILSIPVLSPLYWEFPGKLVQKQVFFVEGGKAIQSPWYGATELNCRIIVQYGPATTSRTFSFIKGNVNWKLSVEYRLEVTDPLKCSDATRDWMVGYRNSEARLSYRTTLPEYFTKFPDRIFESNQQIFTEGTAEDVDKYVLFWSNNVAPPGSHISLTKFERRPQ
jgi:hypothetical protein